MVHVVAAGRDGVHQNGDPHLLVHAVTAGRDGVHQYGDLVGRGWVGLVGMESKVGPRPRCPR